MCKGRMEEGENVYVNGGENWPERVCKLLGQDEGMKVIDSTCERR